MLTLRTLKELIDTPKRGEKLPTPKQLRTGESPVVAHKITGAGVNEVHIIVYQSGYAVYGIGNRATVFPVNLELGYGYSSVTEKKRKEDEKYNTWNPETGLREKKYFCELEESFFEKEEWYLRLMLIGEDRLAHNLATRDRGRCISFNGISEDFEGTTKTSTSPKTGDNTPILFWILLAGVGMAGVGGTVILRKKKKK